MIQKETTDKLDLIKMKNFYSIKHGIKRIRRQAMFGEEGDLRRQATEWVENTWKDISNKGLLFKMYKQLLKIEKQW